METSHIVVTQEMLDAGSRALDLINQADTITGLDGLGGSTTIASAPEEVKPYINREERSICLLFRAMDALSPAPHGESTEKMWDVGSAIMLNLFNLEILESQIKEFGPDSVDYSKFHPALIDCLESPYLAVVYRWMVSAATIDVAQLLISPPDVDDEHMTGRIQLTKCVVDSPKAAMQLSNELIAESAYFTCTPLPDDQYEFAVKADRGALLGAYIAA